MSESILNSVKKVLGVDENYNVFDTDIIMHTNSALATLTQLGVGPDIGFRIEDAGPTWDHFLGDDVRFNSAKSYVYLKVRILFDPPATSFHLASMKEQIQEMEWRLTVQRDYLPTEVSEFDAGDIDDPYNNIADSEVV